MSSDEDDMEDDEDMSMVEEDDEAEDAEDVSENAERAKGEKLDLGERQPFVDRIEVGAPIKVDLSVGAAEATEGLVLRPLGRPERHLLLDEGAQLASRARVPYVEVGLGVLALLDGEHLPRGQEGAPGRKLNERRPRVVQGQGLGPRAALEGRQHDRGAVGPGHLISGGVEGHHLAERIKVKRSPSQ